MRRSTKVDLLVLVAEHEWAQFDLSNPSAHAYTWLADGQVVAERVLDDQVITHFRLRGTDLSAIAARTSIGLVRAALATRTLLDRYEPKRVAQIGFGGLLSDDLRIGDVAVATQVDCYLTKDKASTAQNENGLPRLAVTFAGEVFRTTLYYTRTAINLRYAFPAIAASLQAEIKDSTHLTTLHQYADLREHLRDNPAEPASATHLAHFASAELVSTSDKAVSWLQARDRKTAIIDMESGGMLQAVEEYAARTGQQVDSLVVRGVGGFANEKHELLVGRHVEAFRGLGFEVAAKFLTRLFVAHLGFLPQDGSNVDIGIIIPMEEEFQYFHEMLTASGVDLAAGATRQEGRYYYRFTRGGLSCVVTFVGDMGLVRMALAAEDMRRAFSPLTLVVLGIAAGLVGTSVGVGDVVVASEVDLYLDRAKLRHSDPAKNVRSDDRFAAMPTGSAIPTTPELAAHILASPPLGSARMTWAQRCEQDLRTSLIESGNDPLLIDRAGIQTSPGLHGVRLASGEVLSASAELVTTLKNRRCAAVDMESGGAVVACVAQTANKTTKVIVLRGISDAGDEDKANLERLGSRNFFRRICMRNVTRLLLDLLEEPEFAFSVRMPERGSQ